MCFLAAAGCAYKVGPAPERIRLIGLGVYNLSREAQRQISLDDLLEDAARREEAELQELLAELGARYGLDFAGHLEQIYQADTLHKTVEYMRKHS